MRDTHTHTLHSFAMPPLFASLSNLLYYFARFPQSQVLRRPAQVQQSGQGRSDQGQAEERQRQERRQRCCASCAVASKLGRRWHHSDPICRHEPRAAAAALARRPAPKDAASKAAATAGAAAAAGTVLAEPAVTDTGTAAATAADADAATTDASAAPTPAAWAAGAWRRGGAREKRILGHSRTNTATLCILFILFIFQRATPATAAPAAAALGRFRGRA